MLIETILTNMLLVATLLCTLVTGFVLLFAIVVMPGFGTLADRDFLRAFQVVDRVIQKNQPLFVFVWAGSAVALVIAALLGFGQLEGIQRLLLVVATAVYIIGVQLPTFTINIPLNNRVQTLELDTLDKATLAAERKNFEPRWIRWNSIRTAFAILVSILLTVLLVSI